MYRLTLAHGLIEKKRDVALAAGSRYLIRLEVLLSQHLGERASAESEDILLIVQPEDILPLINSQY